MIAASAAATKHKGEIARHMQDAGDYFPATKDMLHTTQYALEVLQGRGLIPGKPGQRWALDLAAGMANLAILVDNVARPSNIVIIDVENRLLNDSVQHIKNHGCDGTEYYVLKVDVLKKCTSWELE